MPDRIEAGTLLLAGAITRGFVTVENAVPKHLEAVTEKLKDMGIVVTVGNNFITIDASCPLNPVDICTKSYPGFPTDLQAPFLSLLTTVPGVSVVQETVYENRLGHASELLRMAANIRIYPGLAVIEGNPNLFSAIVNGTDLRGTAALILAGLFAKGETVVTGLHHLNRGYACFTEKLTALGADVTLTE